MYRENKGDKKRARYTHTGGSGRGVLKILSRQASQRGQRGPCMPCRGIIGTPCIIACVPYMRCAVCDWIGGDGSREIADP